MISKNKSRYEFFTSVILVTGIFSSSAALGMKTSWFPEMETADKILKVAISPLVALIDLASEVLPQDLQPEEQKILVNLPSGKKVRTLLYSNGEVGKLAVVRCGFTCKGERSDMSVLAANTFREGLGYAHVLVIGSTSGLDYWEDNTSIDIGGYEEALETDELLLHLEEYIPELTGRVNHITLVGVSLGGHASLAFGIMQSRGLIKSRGVSEIVAISPVVDLKRSFDRLFEGDTTSLTMISVIDQQLRLAALVSRPMYDIQEKYQTLTTQQSRRDYLWQELVGHQTGSSWRAYVDLTQSVNQIKVPTLILQAKDDFVVRAKDNSERIVVPPSDNALSVEITRFGSHCAFSEAYSQEMLNEGIHRFLASAHSL